MQIIIHHPTMFLCIITISLLVMANAKNLAERERMGPQVGGAAWTTPQPEQFDPRNGGGNTETRNPPPPILMGRHEHDHSCGGDGMHHQYPWYV